MNLYKMLATCSMREVGSLSMMDTVTKMKREIKTSGVKAFVSCTTSEIYSERLIKAGFRLIGSYPGNHGMVVLVHAKLPKYALPLVKIPVKKKTTTKDKKLSYHRI